MDQPKEKHLLSIRRVLASQVATTEAKKGTTTTVREVDRGAAQLRCDLIRMKQDLPPLSPLKKKKKQNGEEKGKREKRVGHCEKSHLKHHQMIYAIYRHSGRSIKFGRT